MKNLPPLQITFRGIDHSDAIEEAVRKKAAKLAKFHDQIMSCKVVVESAHKHHHKGKLYNIRIDLKIPGHEIAVNRGSRLDHSHEDIYVAIRDSFNEAKRRIQDHGRRKQGKVKSHMSPQHGRIIKLDPAEEHGVIETREGRIINFHRNSVVNNAFSRLKEGSEVRFVTGEYTPGEESWATTVRPVGKHHINEQ